MDINQAYFIGMLVLAIVTLIAIITPVVKLTTSINKLTNSVNNLSEKYENINTTVTAHGQKIDEHDKHFVKVDCEIDNLKEKGDKKK